MRIRRMDFKERYHMDKSVRKALIATSILVLCTAIIGIMVANGIITSARSNTRIDTPVTGTGNQSFVQGLTIYDRIRYWKGDGVSRGTIEQDMNEGIKYWQAIPAEYSAGRIISDNPYTVTAMTNDNPKGKEAYCPVKNFRYTSSSSGKISTASWISNDFGQDPYKAFCGYKGGLSGFKSVNNGDWTLVDGQWKPGPSTLIVKQTKDLRAWIDYYDGAAYEDKFYDMRVYGWSSRSAVLRAYKGYGPSMAAHDFYVPIAESSVYEFHFYPSGTLKQLQSPNGEYDIIYKGPRPAARVNAKASEKDQWQQGYDLYYDYEAYFNNARDKDGNKANYLKDCSGDNCDVCLGLPKAYYKDKTSGKEYPREDGRLNNKSRKCYTDTAAYRDENGNIVYTGVYGHFEDGYTPGADAEAWLAMSYKNAEHFIIDYTAKEYEEYLKEKEKSINPLTPDEEDPAASETQGVFKGTIKINQWLTSGPYISIMGGGTVEKNADGTTIKKDDVNVYTEHNKTFYISNPWKKMNLNKNGEVRNYMKNKYCPSDDNAICNYRWTTVNGGTTYDPYHEGGTEGTIWLTFTSSYENPFTYVWDWGNCAHADVGEDTYTVAYVFDGDVGSLPDDYPEIYEQIKKFNEEYKRVYEQDLKDDPFFQTAAGQDVDPSRVYKLFKVAKYSDYDPYAINESLPKDSGIDKEEFGWYNCEAMEDDCLIPNDNPNHESGDQERNGVNYLNGYDFIDGDRVYYGCLSCSLATYFPNTCYSNKNEPDKIKNFTDQNDEQPGIGEEKERQQ